MQLIKKTTAGFIKSIILFELLLTILNVSGQHIAAYKEIYQTDKESGEIPFSIPKKTNGNGWDDYLSFKKAKAWNQTLKATVLNSPEEIGPMEMGGRVRSLLVDTTNGIYLAAPSGGGLWNFHPALGTPFTPIDDFGSFMAVTSIAQNPFAPHVIYASTGSINHGTKGSGVFKSVDGGATFNPLPSTLPQHNPDFEYINTIQCAPTHADHIYMSCQNKLYRSEDAGLTWSMVFQAPHTIKSFCFSSLTSIVVSVDYAGVFKSINGNSGTFTQLTGNIRSTNVQGVVVASYPGNRAVLYAYFVNATAVHEFYKSSDGGNNWVPLSVPNYYVAQPTFCLTIGVSPNDSNTVVVGNIGWAYTLDGGSSWKEGCDLEVDFHHVHFHASQPRVAYLGYDQGIGRVDFENMDSIICWSGTPHYSYQPNQKELGKSGGFNTTQIYYGDYFPSSYGNSIVEGQQDGGCFAVFENGQEERVAVGDGGAVFINKQNPDEVFVSTQFGNLKKSNAATTLPSYNSYSSSGSFSGNHPNWITQFVGNNADGNQVYIASSDSLYRTENGGNTYTAFADNNALSGVLLAISHKNNPTLYAIGYKSASSWNSDLLKIENAKTSLNSEVVYNDLLDFGADGFPNAIYVDPNNEHIVYITTTNGNAYKISNLNGPNATVTTLKGNATNVHFNTVIGMENYPDLLLAGTNIGLFYSEDAGVNWVLSNAIPYTKINDLKYRSNDNQLFVFTYGRGAWTCHVNDPTDILPLKNKAMVTLFPNPVLNGVINVVSEKKETTCYIMVYDIAGKLVMDDILGPHKTSLSIHHLPKGEYIVHLKNQSGKMVGIEKLVVVN